MKVRLAIRDRYDAALRRRVALLDDAELRRSLLVVAPHPDDETLASGGLIIRSRRSGADVQIVFVSDGAGSHPAMDRDALAAQRRDEALAAAAVLDVASDHVHFLELPDGGVTPRLADGIDGLAPIIAAMRPERLVAPHGDEPHPDHRATYEIAVGALGRVGHGVDALLAPVWLWDQFPWTHPLSPPRMRRSVRHTAALSVRQALGLRLVRQLDAGVDVSDVLERKRRALDEHRSQMARRDGDPAWITLEDIADGDWLAQLLRPSEYFTARRLGPGGVHS